MNQYRVKFSKKSYSHLLEIKNYIKDTLQAPLTAKEFLNKLHKRMAALSSMPARYPVIKKYNNHNIHRMTLGNFLVYFYIKEELKEELKEVRILAASYGKAAQLPALKKILKGIQREVGD